MLDIPSAWAKEREQRVNVLPRLGHTETWKTNVVLHAQNENVSKELTHENEVPAKEISGKSQEGDAPTHNQKRCDEVPSYVELQRSANLLVIYSN